MKTVNSSVNFIDEVCINGYFDLLIRLFVSMETDDNLGPVLQLRSVFQNFTV